jgi:hypothetical protein
LLEVEYGLLQLLYLPAALLMRINVLLLAESMKLVEFYRLKLASKEGRRAVVGSGLQGLIADGTMKFLLETFLTLLEMSNCVVLLRDLTFQLSVFRG